MSYVIPPAPIVALPAVSRKGDSLGEFPVRRVFCIGRNYAAHAIEMGHDPNREAPFFFQKHPCNIVAEGGAIRYPSQTNEMHHEVELVVALRFGGADISLEEATDCVYGYAVGIDLTRRDLQAMAKKASRPWDVAKSFEQSAPISAVVSYEGELPNDDARIWLDVNGENRQQGKINQMIWKIPEIIAYLSTYFELAPGDLIMTGTPAGVGPVNPGDQISCGVDGIARLSMVSVLSTS